jgi:ATP-dependent Lon protease
VIGVVTQRRAEEEDPGAADLYTVGTVARVVKLLKMGEDNYSLVVQGLPIQGPGLVQEPYLRHRRSSRTRARPRCRGRALAST